MLRRQRIKTESKKQQQCGFYMQTHASFWDLHHHKMPSQFLLAGESSAGMQFIQTKTVRERTDTRKREKGDIATHIILQLLLLIKILMG